MAGRMWGWLLICDPAEQTAGDLAEALQASRGAISGTARMLATAGMIRRTKRGGDRREFFSAPPEAFDQFLANAGRIYRHFREIAERGLAAIEDRPPADQGAARGVPRRLRLHGAGGPGRRRPVPPRTCRRDRQEGPIRMTAVIHTEQTDQELRPPPWHHRPRPRRRGGRDLRLPRAERRRQDDDDARPARPHPPDVGGAAEVFGIETTADPVAIHRRIGYLPGEFDLYDRLTGADTIDYFANLRGGVDPAYVAELIERLDLDPSRRFKEYSKGNKQKVGLVVALQHRPDLLILDEPTSGLDPLVQQTFFEIVREARAEGRTIFLRARTSSSEVDRTCDRVAIIREGRLVQVDRVEAIRRPGLPPGRADDSSAPVADGRLRGDRRRQRRRGRRTTSLRMRVAGPIAPVVRRGGQLRARRLREPRAHPRGDVPRPVRSRRGRWPDMTTDVERRPSPAVPTSPVLRSGPASTGSAASSARPCATAGARS